MIFINGCTSLPVLHRHLEDEQGKIYIAALITEKLETTIVLVKSTNS